MVTPFNALRVADAVLSVLALSSRFDGLKVLDLNNNELTLSVLALSSRFDGLVRTRCPDVPLVAFSTRSVESF